MDRQKAENLKLKFPYLLSTTGEKERERQRNKEREGGREVQREGGRDDRPVSQAHFTGHLGQS